MARKKSAPVKLFAEPPVTRYTYVNNRLVIFDWASLAYHMFHSSAKYDLPDAEQEINVWRVKMITRVMDYIALFNPRHVVFALEGKAAWRKAFVEDYYNKHAEVYWNKNEYYVKADNILYLVQKGTDGGYMLTKLNIKDAKKLADLKHKPLGEMPEQQRSMFWSLYTPGGDPIVPSYKGQRKSKPWTFKTDKKVWAKYREQFAMELAPLFRARPIQCLRAEGDDIIYSTMKQYAGECDDVIIITRDSDMSQISNRNVRIFNHQTNTFSSMQNPEKFLDEKVLYGDTSDNIPGMAFVDQNTGNFKPEKNTRLSDKGAATLLEKCPNVYEKAKAEGWVDQYNRNRTLIDLSRVPADVQKEIQEAIDLVPEPKDAAGFERLRFWGVTDMVIGNYLRLQTAGFYAVNSVNSGRQFDSAMFARATAEAERPKIDIDDSVVTADNIGLDDVYSDIDVPF